MLEVIFIFSDCVLTEQIIASSNPFSVFGETDFQKILPGVMSGGLGHGVRKHRFNDFLRMSTP